MGQILTSISGLPISAASAGFAPTNSAEVSAIASGYQVVSSTATQLYAGTAYLTSVNETPVSASRAGNAANAGMANSAYYDGTGRLISALPDSAAVSAIASSYAESAASGKLDSSASSSFYTTANESGFVDSAYVEGQVSGKQDALTFDWDADSAISSINGSALAGQGGAPVVVTGTAWDPDTSAYVFNLSSNLSGLESRVWTWQNGNKSDYISKFKDDSGNNFMVMASVLEAGAEQTYDGGIYGNGRLQFSPNSSMFKADHSNVYGLSPLTLATGASMNLSAGYFRASYRGDTIFISRGPSGTIDSSNSSQIKAVRIEAHNNRGANISAYGARSTGYYGDTEMRLSHSGVLVDDSGNSSNTASNLTLTTGSLQFKSAGSSDTMRQSSIPYWNAKLDASSIECDTASAITAIGGSSIAGGGVDSATVSSIASSYAESAASGKQDVSAMTAYQLSGDYAYNSSLDGYIPTSESSKYVTSLDGYATEEYVDSSVSGKQDSSAMTAYQPSGDYAYNSALTAYQPVGDYAYNSSLDGYIPTSESSKYVTSLAGYATEEYVDSSVSGKMDSSAMTAYQLSGDYAYNSSLTGYIPTSESSKYVTSLAGYATEEYVDSSVSGKQDASAMTAYQLSGDYAYNSSLDGYIPTSESSKYVTSLSGYATEEYVDSAVSGKLDATSQVVTATAGDGTYVTSINGMGISGQGGGVDSATVSSIASSYAESAASGKLDTTAQVVTSTGSASAMMMGGTSYYASQINGLNISAQKAYLADEWMHADIKLDTTAFNSGDFYSTSNPSSFVDSAYVESQVSGKQDTLTFDWDADSAISSINGSALAGQGGAQVVTSITTGGYGVRTINGMGINASHMVIGAAAANNTSNIVRLGDENYGAGVYLTGSFGTAYYKVNELQLNRNGTGFIAFNIGAAGSQITATSNAGGKFSAGGTGGNRSYFTAFNASASASIEVTGDTAMINITDTGYTSTIYPSSITYWNAKLDASAIECDTASAITAIGGSSVGGGVDSATVSAIASSYAESAASGKQDSSAMTAYQPTSAMSAYAMSSEVSGVIDTVSSNSASWGVSGGDVYVSGFAYNDTAISSIEGSSLYDYSAHARITTVAGRVNNKMDSSAVQSAYASASATQATATDVLYILIPDGV